MTQEWAEPSDREHLLFRASADIKDPEGHELVTAYPLKRPDGLWAILLVNKDHDSSHRVRIMFHDENTDRTFAGAVTSISFGKAQYQWHSGRLKGYADPDGPPVTSKVVGTHETQYDLPAASITVLRGSVR